MNAPAFNPNSEIENGRKGVFRGAHASGVWFSASRRKHGPANFFLLEIPGSVWDESSGATPELARETRALSIPVSEFGLKTCQTLAKWITRTQRSALRAFGQHALKMRRFGG
jgi:hypothetical protein